MTEAPAGRVSTAAGCTELQQPPAGQVPSARRAAHCYLADIMRRVPHGVGGALRTSWFGTMGTFCSTLSGELPAAMWPRRTRRVWSQVRLEGLSWPRSCSLTLQTGTCRVLNALTLLLNDGSSGTAAFQSELQHGAGAFYAPLGACGK